MMALAEEGAMLVLNHKIPMMFLTRLMIAITCGLRHEDF